MSERVRAEHLLERARDDDLAAVLARAGPDVDDVVGDADRLFVVLDDDHGVAEIAQPDERVDEALVVALVQADRRLVEHVQHADQPAADLRREPDALRLAARQRGRRPVEREVVEADVEQEAQALVHLLLDRVGDHAVALGELDRAEELGGLADRELAQLVDVDVADGDRQRLRPQARAVDTRGTAPRACSPRSARASGRSRRPGAGARATGSRPRTAWCTTAGARSGCGTTPSPTCRRCRRARPSCRSCCSFFHGVVDGEAVLRGERLEHALEVVAAEPRPRRDRAVAQREVVVRARPARDRPRTACRGRRSARTRRTAS